MANTSGGGPDKKTIENTARELIQSKKEAPELFKHETLRMIRLFARGRGDKLTRDMYYAGWKKEDFQALLAMLSLGD